MANLLRRARAYSLHHGLLFAEAWLLLAVMRAIIFAVSFPRVARLLRLRPTDADPAAVPPPPMAERVGWAVRAAAYYSFWGNTCLAQGIACAIMLRRRGQAGTLYLGMRRVARGRAPVQAHAWLRCGDQILVGGSRHAQYTVVARFVWDG